MGSWLFSCHAGLRRNWRRGMFCRRSLHKGTALLRRFCMRRLHLSFSCAADRLYRAARRGRRRNRIVWHCIWSSCHSGRSALCIRRLPKGASLLCGFGLYRLSLCIAAVIRFSCGAGRLIGTARRTLVRRFSCRTVQNRPTVILHRRAAARMGSRLGMYGLFLLRILHDCAAHDGLRSSCGMIRRTGRGFGCRGRCMVLRRCHMPRSTSCAGRHSSFACGIRLFAGSSGRSLRKCT